MVHVVLQLLQLILGPIGIEIENFLNSTDTMVLSFQPLLILATVAGEKEKRMQLTAVFMQVPEGFIAFVEELPGANTQGETLDEARDNLREAVQMVLDANREIAERSIIGKIVSKEPFDLSAS